MPRSDGQHAIDAAPTQHAAAAIAADVRHTLGALDDLIGGRISGMCWGNGTQRKCQHIRVCSACTPYPVSMHALSSQHTESLTCSQ